MPEPRGPRSGGGICPDTGCSGGEGAARFYGDLMEHVRRAHPKKVWSPDDFIGNTSGIVVCECGAPAVSKKGLRQHQGKTGCVGLERFLQNQTASRLPTANEVRQPRRPGRPSPMNSPTGVLSHSDDDVNARIFGQGLRRPREHSEQSMDVVEDPYPASLDPSPGDFSRTSSPLFETQVLTGGPALLPPAPMDVGTDLSDECLPSRLRANFGFEEMKNAFTALASLPTTYRPLPPPIATSFAQAAERVANRFLADASSERAIFEFLCLPKMGLAPGQGTASTARLAKYPDVSAPQISRPSGESFRSNPSAEKQVELGRLGNAARILGEENSFASASFDTVRELRQKHPVGPLFPFGSLVGQGTPKPPTQEQLLDSFRTFKHDTAPGISGWTVPLLKVAMRSDAVKKMLTMLAGMLLAGTAPGRNFLCSSRLIALDKPDGGVRPIAVGELIYRLCTKAILRCSFKPDCLSPSQFGVGTRGGVEPLIRAVQRAIDGSIEGKDFTHVTSLDFSNAFNTLDRRDLATSIRRHAGGLYRLAKWAYDNPSDLILGGIQGPPAVILSSQGVRQGDPLGPLFFSIGVRPIIDNLSNALGPDCIVMAYLDDVYILSTSADTLSDVKEFFEANECSLKLNVVKSFTTSVEDIKANGLKMLGTCLGPKEARSEFLKTKIQDLELKIGRLVGLPHQHALLLLRQCLQQDLRHLQRCLISDDLTDLWKRLDQIIWDAALRMRSAKEIPGVDTSRLDNQLLALPVRLGGLGLLSHQICAPLAFSAARDISDNLLVPLLGPPAQPPTLSNPDEPDSIAPQRIRCNKVFEEQRNTLLCELDGHQIKTIIESASGLGKKWLFVVPFYQSLRLTDFEVSAGLHARTLHPGSDSACAQCHALNEIGHADVCVHRKRWNIARHEQVKRAIASTLSRIEGATVTVEPHIGETNRRNDIRVIGSEASGLASHEYDVTVVSLKSRDSVETRLPPNLLPTNPAERGHALIGRFLEQTATNKRNRLPEGRRRMAFDPLVFSVGGCMDKGTVACLRLWQGVLPPSAFSAMCQQLSLILLRARAKSFVA